MDIFIQSDIYIRMAKHFADTLDISPIADTVCSQMYGAVRESETSLYMLYPDKNKTCTDKYGVPSGKIYSTHKPQSSLQERRSGKRNSGIGISRTEAERFWAALIQNRFPILLPDLNPLDSPVNMNCFSLEVDIFPF